MREILFRGKRKDNGKWVYGHLASFLDGVKASIHPPYYLGVVEEMNFYCVDPFTVGQYTGMNDKNDKRIFEGDIIQFGDKRLVVWWNAEAFQWQAKEQREVVYTYKAISDRAIFDNIDLGWIYAEIPCLGRMTTEIIGNIYDNPELGAFYAKQ